MGDPLDLVAAQVATLFVLTDAGRIVRENDPPRSAGPRLYIGGCESGNVVHTRHDVGDAVTREIVALAAEEPPLREPRSRPLHLDAYVALLAPEAPVEVSLGVTYVVPDSLEYAHGVTLACSGSREGDRVLAGIAAHGMPTALAEMGYTTFWEPWCVAMHEGEIASVVETVRNAPVGVEAGVSTVPVLRGRGYAAAATFGWSWHPALRDRPRFYSTSQTNTSSQAVAARLGLRFLGASLRVT